MSAYVGFTTIRPGESKTLIFTFTGASSLSGEASYIYRNGQDVSAVATGTSPSTILSGSNSASGVTITSKVVTIPLTGYFGSTLRFVWEGTVDGQILKPWLEIRVPSELISG